MAQDSGISHLRLTVGGGEDVELPRRTGHSVPEQAFRVAINGGMGNYKRAGIWHTFASKLNSRVVVRAESYLIPTDTASAHQTHAMA